MKLNKVFIFKNIYNSRIFNLKGEILNVKSYYF